MERLCFHRPKEGVEAPRTSAAGGIYTNIVSIQPSVGQRNFVFGHVRSDTLSSHPNLTLLFHGPSWLYLTTVFAAAVFTKPLRLCAQRAVVPRLHPQVAYLEVHSVRFAVDLKRGLLLLGHTGIAQQERRAAQPPTRTAGTLDTRKSQHLLRKRLEHHLTASSTRML